MRKEEFTLLPQEAVFTFCYLGGKLYVSSKTELVSKSQGETSVKIIGFCCDAYGELDRNEIADYILSHSSSNISTVFNACNRLAGHYVIFFKNNNNEYVWGDATCSIQINYSIGKTISIASTDKMVADICGYDYSKKSIDIRNSSVFEEEALPYNWTMYDEVKALLPNHYLDINKKEAIRVHIEKQDINGTAVNDVLEKTYRMVSNIASAFAQEFTIACPMTSGHDSRVVYSFMKKQTQKIECYTTFLNGFNDQTDDIVISKKICNDLGQKHTIFKEENAPKEYEEKIQEYCGKYQFKRTMDSAYRFLSVFPNHAIVDSDILDQIGKGNNIPSSFVTAYYLSCKLHSKSKYTKMAFKEYLKSCKKESLDKFSLYAWEMRIGRWAAQTNMLYALGGLPNLNIFNSREIILLWLNIQNKQRREHIIHNYYLKQNAPNLMPYPYNPSEKYSLIRSKWYLYYFATIIRNLIS